MKPLGPAAPEHTSRFDSGLLGDGRRALTVGLVLVFTGVAFEALAVTTVMPAVGEDLGGIRLYGWAFSAFMLGNLVGIAVAGPVGDRSGPAGPFQLGLALFGAGLLGAGLAPTMLLVVAARSVQGLGGGAVLAAAYVAIGRGYPEDRRPRLFAVLSSAWVVPGIAGPALAGAVAEGVGWRAVFLGMVPLLPVAGFLALPSLRRLEPDPRGGEGAAPVADAVRLAAGAGVALAGLSSRQPVVAAIVFTAGAGWSWPALRRLLPEGTLRGRGALPSAIAVRGLTAFAFFGAEAFLPLALTSFHRVGTTGAGLALACSAVTWAMGSWAQARRGRRWGGRRTIVTGLVLVAIGVGGLTALLWPGSPILTAALAWSVAGFGMGLVYSAASLVVLEEAAGHEVGRASSALQLADVLGVALGTGIGGAALALAVGNGWGRRPGLAMADAIALGAALVALVASRELPTSRSPAVERPV